MTATNFFQWKIKSLQQGSDEKLGLAQRRLQLEEVSIWIPQASRCSEVIISHPFFSLGFVLIRAVLILQLELPPPFL